jgi:hypothetical protein
VKYNHSEGFNPYFLSMEHQSRFPHYRSFKVKFGKSPLDDKLTRRLDLHLTTHNTRKTQNSMPTAGFEPTIPASKRPQIPHVRPLCQWDRILTYIYHFLFLRNRFCPKTAGFLQIIFIDLLFVFTCKIQDMS